MAHQRLSAGFPTVSEASRSPTHSKFLLEIRQVSPTPEHLNQLVSRIYAAELPDDEKDELHQLVNRKRSVHRVVFLTQSVLEREASTIRFLRRQEPRSPYRRASRDRRRRWAGSGALPPEV